MMKNKIMTVLLLTGAGFCQGAQAMGGARNFAKRVLFSKTAIAAGTVAAVNGAIAYDRNEKRVRVLKTAPQTELPVRYQRKAREIFEQHGYFITILDAELGGDAGLGVWRHKDEVFLFLSKNERAALSGGKVWFLGELQDGIKARVFKEEHALAAIKHELFHVVCNDPLTKDVLTAGTVPVSIMAGKMMRVAGRGKILACGAALGAYLGGLVIQQKYSQMAEIRCDRKACDNAKDAQLLAQGLDFDEGDEQEESILEKLLGSHPPVSERIKELEKRWGTLDLDSLTEEDKGELLIMLMRMRSR